MATYAIGDLQGCFQPLQALLDLTGFDPSRDRLWFTGDIVNRGPQSLECLRYIQNLGPCAQIVLGNHDLHLLAVAAGRASEQKNDTFAEVLGATDCAELITWLRHQPLLYYNKPYVLVHAGLLPNWSVDQAISLAREVEKRLQANNWGEFMGHLYGNQPNAWSDNLTGWERLRVIVNGCTRLRYCTPEGEMDFHHKESPFDDYGEPVGPVGCVPWFFLPNRQSKEATILCGHWSLLGLQILPNVITLDTGCIWGGPLTALRLEDRCVFQVPGVV